MLPRVAVTAEQFWHRVPGGTARASGRIIEELVAAGRHQLVGVAARHSATARSAIELPIAIHEYPVPRPVLYESWHRLGLFDVERLVGPVDVIWAAAMVVPPRTAPLVVTVHDLDFLHHPERLSPRGRRFFPRTWRATRERADLIICDATSVATDLMEEGIAADRVRVVPLGVDLVEVPAGEAQAARVRHGLPERFALWVGTLEPRKNLANLVTAVRGIEGLTLAVVGPDGWEVDGTDLLAPLEGRVVRVGRVSDAELHALYAAATVFVLPSLAEGFGLPVLEAMAQGTPVVTSSGTATEEVAGDAAVLVDPTDSDAIGAGICSVLDSSALADRLRVAGPIRAAKFPWRATADGYADAFDLLVGR